MFCVPKPAVSCRCSSSSSWELTCGLICNTQWKNLHKVMKGGAQLSSSTLWFSWRWTLGRRVAPVNICLGCRCGGHNACEVKVTPTGCPLPQWLVLPPKEETDCSCRRWCPAAPACSHPSPRHHLYGQDDFGEARINVSPRLWCRPASAESLTSRL